MHPGAYQGWPQFCDGPDSMAYQCHVNGNLCPWANATAASFTQDSYEACIVANNISQCIISTDVVAKLGDQFKRYAPGYWSQPGSFINHEFFKHGSCATHSLPPPPPPPRVEPKAFRISPLTLKVCPCHTGGLRFSHARVCLACLLRIGCF